MKKEPEQLVKLIAQTLFDKKGSNILALDVKGVSTLTDYFVIAEGTVYRHIKALSKVVLDTMKLKGVSPIHVEESEDWIVIDYLDIIIHLFTPGLRDTYRLEELWKEGKIFDVELMLER